MKKNKTKNKETKIIEKEAKNISFKWKAIFMLELFILIVNVLSAFAIWSIFNSVSHKALQEKLIAVASTAAIAINVEEHEAIKSQEDISSSAYQNISGFLQKIQKANNGIAAIYTMRKTSNENTLEFVVDAGEEVDTNGNGIIDDEEANAEIGESYDISEFPQMHEAFDGPIADEKVSCDKWGCWLSGYAPVYDSSGNVVAIVGVDMSNADTVAFLKNLRMVSIMAIVVLVAIIQIFFYLIFSRLIKPIREISRGMKLFKNDMSVRLNIETGDEFEDISKEFNDTANELEKLYENMERTVKEKTNELANRVNETERDKAKDEAILASIGDGLMATDHKGRIIMLNKIAMEILGVDDLESVLHTDYYCAVPLRNDEGEIVACNNLPIHQALNTGQINFSRYGYKKKDGEKITIAMTAAPIVLKNKITGVIVTLRDVTREEEIDRAKSEFVSLASHQLRTPLSMIKWYVEMLIDENVDAGIKNKKYLNEISKANYRMIELVTALLNVSRIELGTFSIKPENVDVVNIIKEIIQEINPITIDKKTKIETDFENIPKIKADPMLTRIVIQNIISNAVKYTPLKGTVSISVKLVKSSGSKKKDTIAITVADTGYGIPKNQQKDIFKKLFRADNAREKVIDGNGLGLYMTKQILENSGGSISFTSVENKGTTFVTSLSLSGMPEKKGTRQLNLYPEIKNSIQLENKK